MKNRKSAVIRLVVPWVLLVALLLLFDPTRLPSTTLVVPFILLFVAIYLAITEGMSLLRGGGQNGVVGTRSTKSRLIAGLIACLPVLLLTLQSIGQLTMWDVLMVVGLFVIAYFYIIKSSIAPSGQ